MPTSNSLVHLVICQEAGGVVSIRLVVDFETGRPKGFAFVEYEDAATALSAIRNLNGYECNNRPVRYSPTCRLKLSVVRVRDP